MKTEARQMRIEQQTVDDRTTNTGMNKVELQPPACVPYGNKRTANEVKWFTAAEANTTVE